MKAAEGILLGLGRVALRMAAALEIDELLGAITRGLIADLDQAALARIWLVRPENPGSLSLVASAGLSDNLDGSHANVAIGSLKIGEIARTREAVCTNNLLSDPRFADKAWIEANKLTTFAGYPLVFKDELVGVLALFARGGREGDDAGGGDPDFFEALGAFAAQAAVAIKNARLFEEVNALSLRLESENSYLKRELAFAFDDTRAIVGASAALKRVLSELERVAPTSSTVLLLGETGTGKELFAHALHRMSAAPRQNGPLVKVSAAAFTQSLIESELFGHERGAFTGATQRRIGRFELAQGGTLFLDEIGELPLETQTKLLRVLQEHEIERVGGTRPIRVDARIVAATNRDLAVEVKANRFRADLFYRLNVFPITIPPLRDRREDIPAIATSFLGQQRIDDDALTHLQAYDWPGNVRELRNVLERASILARSHDSARTITLADLPELSSPSPSPSSSSASPSTLPLKERVQAYEKTIVADALREAEGNQSEAARLLGTSRTALQYKLKILGLA